MRKVKVNNKTLKFPDSMTEKEILQVLRKKFPPKKSAKKTPATPASTQQQFGRQSSGLAIGREAGRFAAQVGKGAKELYQGADQLQSELRGDKERSQQIAQEYADEQEQLSGKDRVARAIGKGGAMIAAASPASKMLQGVGALGRIGLASGSGAVESFFTPSQSDENFADQKIQDVARGSITGLAVGGGFETAKLIARIGKNIFFKPKSENIIADRISPERRAEALQRLEGADSDSPLALVDVAGDEMRGLARSASKMPKTQNIISEPIKERSTSELDRVTKQINRVSPRKDVNTFVDETKKEGKKASSPLYKEAFAEDTRLSKKDNKELFLDIQEDLYSAKKDFRIRGMDKYLKSKKDVLDKTAKDLDIETKDLKKLKNENDNIIKRASGDSNINDPKELIELGNKYQESLKTIRENKPKRLLQYIKEQGGIADSRGELKAIGIDNKTLPGLLRKEGTKGVSIDDVGEKLFESGRYAERPSVSDVLKEIDSDVRNQNVFMRFGSKDKFEEAAIFVDEFDRSGLDIDQIKKLDIGANKVFKKLESDIKDAEKGLPIKFADKAKRALDTKIKERIEKGKADSAMVLQEIKAKLLDKLDEISPKYKKARKTDEIYKKIQSSAKNGKKFNNANISSQDIKKIMSGLNNKEKVAYRIGVAEKLQEMADGIVDTGSPAKKIFGNTKIRNKLKQVFGNDKDYNRYAKNLRDEIDIRETKDQVVGGSKSDINNATDSQVIENIADGSSFAATAARNRPEAFARVVRIFSKKYDQLNSKNAKEIAKALVYRKDGIKMLKKIIEKEKDIQQKKVMLKIGKSLRPQLFTTILINNNK